MSLTAVFLSDILIAPLNDHLAIASMNAPVLFIRHKLLVFSIDSIIFIALVSFSVVGQKFQTVTLEEK